MSGQRPRISVVVDPPVLDTLRRVAAVRDVSVSSLVGELLSEFEPGMRQVAVLGEALERLTEVQREQMRAAISQASTELAAPLLATVEGASEVLGRFQELADEAAEA